MDTFELPQLSIQVPNFAQEPAGWASTLSLARLADEVGVDRIVVSDHVAFGEHLAAYADPALGGTTGGKQPTDPDGHWLEPLTLLSVIAGQTSRVRLATGILLAALRTPAVLAKQAATLDVLSNGRLDLGVGVGWQREEYEACGLDFGRRGALLDRCLEICGLLWTERGAHFDDGDISFDRIHAMPKPLQPGGVPLWISGRINPAAVRRVVRFGTGWIPWGDHIADPGPGVEVLRRELANAGRDPDLLQVQGTLPVVRDVKGHVDVEATVGGVPDLLRRGVTDFRFHHRFGNPESDRDLLTAVVSTFRAMVGRTA